MIKYLNPKNDFAFKGIFGPQENLCDVARARFLKAETHRKKPQVSNRGKVLWLISQEPHRETNSKLARRDEKKLLEVLAYDIKRVSSTTESSTGSVAYARAAALRKNFLNLNLG